LHLPLQLNLTKTMNAMEQRRSITLLADREAETLAQRLRDQPKGARSRRTYAAARPVWKRLCAKTLRKKTAPAEPKPT
jgi:hypothetical protein